MKKTLETFLQAVGDFHANDYEHRVQFLAEHQLPCGFFYPHRDEYLPEQLARFERAGIRLSMIVTLGGALPSASVSLVPLDQFPQVASKPAVMFLADEAFSYCFTPFFLQQEVASLLLPEPPDRSLLHAKKDFYLTHLPELYEAYASLGDDVSRQTFLGALKYESSASPSDRRTAPEPQYFLDGFTVRPGDVAIDAGAYDGETARQFLAAGAGSVYSFELDAENFAVCQKAAAQDGFVVENFGLSNRKETARYTRMAISSANRRSEDGDCEARFTSIDDYVREHALPRVDFIKMDIEGAELEALQGAEQTIARWKPRMALSAYHKPEDYWTLLHYVRSIRPDYEFAFRHYATPIEDSVFTDEMRTIVDHYHLPRMVPANWERVLYCR